MPCDLAVLIPDVYNTGQASHLLSLDVNSKLGPVMLASLLINVLAISRRALEKTWGINSSPLKIIFLKRLLSVQFSHSVMSDSLQPHGLQHARLPCPSPIPGVYSNSCPLSRWCHLTISSPAVLFSFCLQSFPASGTFPMSWLLSSGQVLELQFLHQSFQWIFRVDFF